MFRHFLASFYHLVRMPKADCICQLFFTRCVHQPRMHFELHTYRERLEVEALAVQAQQRPTEGRSLR